MVGRIIVALVSVCVSLTAVSAQAHTLGANGLGFLDGFGHPVSGIDHILAMIAVGVWASQEKRSALWVLPTSFVAMMVVGALLGVMGAPMPAAELGIAASVLVLGALIAASARLPLAAAAAFVGACAVLHGHAHGAEMPEAASPMLYGLGFVFGTSLLHAIGVGLGCWARSKSAHFAVRIGGSAMAAVGLALLIA